MTRLPTDGTGPIEFDAQTGRYRTEFDPSSVPPSRAVVAVVATIDGEDVTALEPLNDAVDPDALDRLLEASPTRPQRGPRTVEFEYRSYRITVRSEGVVEVRRDPDSDR